MPGQVYALGTAAGTLIRNTVEVSFQVGDSTGTIHTETASDVFKVSELIRGNVTNMNPDGVAAPAPAQDVILTFQLTNTGNGEETFLLDTDTLQGDFAAEITALWLESNGVPGWQDSDTRYQDGTGVALQADEIVTVYVVGNIPADQEHEAQGNILLTATSATPGADLLEVGEALPAAANNGVEAVIAQANASDQDSGVYVVSGIKLDVKKEVLAVRDPYHGERVMPGSEVTYQITVAATGQGVAKDLQLNDPAPASMSYKKNSLALNGSALSDQQDDDRAYFDQASDTVWFKPGDISAPATYQYTLTYVVD
ncbi:MAG: hypothetical protein R3F02_17975 [Thiolinea sp.]